MRIEGDHFIDDHNQTTHSIAQLDLLLNDALDALSVGSRKDARALGWIGFDLLYETDSREWFVIEANPRLTTSFVGLNAACGGGLAATLLQAAKGPLQNFPEKWRACSFSANPNESQITRDP